MRLAALVEAEPSEVGGAFWFGPNEELIICCLSASVTGQWQGWPAKCSSGGKIRQSLREQDSGIRHAVRTADSLHGDQRRAAFPPSSSNSGETAGPYLPSIPIRLPSRQWETKVLFRAMGQFSQIKNEGTTVSTTVFHYAAARILFKIRERK